MFCEVCDGVGCHAGFKLTPPVLSAFREGLEAKVRVCTDRSHAVDFALSLKGFSAGYRYISEQTAR